MPRKGKQAYTEVFKRQLAPLDELARKYGFLTQEANDLAKAQDLVMQMLGGPNEQQAFARLTMLEDVAKVEAQIVELRRQAAASAPAGEAAIRRARDTEAFGAELSSQLERLQTPREERLELRLRTQARRKGIELGRDEEAALRQISAQERLNSILGTVEQVGDRAIQTLTTGLLSLGDATVSVGESFKAMAKSILDSISQIVLNESFKMLLQLGLGLLGGVLTGGAGTGVRGSAGTFNAPLISMPYGTAQAGAVVNKPTLMMVGEGATNPEVILNKPQLNSLVQSAMRAGPSAGGQAAGGITIINVASKQEGELQAARERGMGRQVVLNYVMDDLSQGEGSRIGRVMRAGGR